MIKYLSLVCFLIPSVAFAHDYKCNLTEVVHDWFKDNYQEEIVAFGPTNNGSLIEVLGNSETWTLIVTMPNDISCIVATGEAWRTKIIKKLIGNKT